MFRLTIFSFFLFDDIFLLLEQRESKVHGDIIGHSQRLFFEKKFWLIPRTQITSQKKKHNKGLIQKPLRAKKKKKEEK